MYIHKKERKFFFYVPIYFFLKPKSILKLSQCNKLLTTFIISEFIYLIYLLRILEFFIDYHYLN